VLGTRVDSLCHSSKPLPLDRRTLGGFLPRLPGTPGSCPRRRAFSSSRLRADCAVFPPSGWELPPIRCTPKVRSAKTCGAMGYRPCTEMDNVQGGSATRKRTKKNSKVSIGRLLRRFGWSVSWRLGREAKRGSYYGNAIAKEVVFLVLPFHRGRPNRCRHDLARVWGESARTRIGSPPMPSIHELRSKPGHGAEAKEILPADERRGHFKRIFLHLLPVIR